MTKFKTRANPNTGRIKKFAFGENGGGSVIKIRTNFVKIQKQQTNVTTKI